ncbi:tryptophan-rich sensory protein [Patescibacteria group bacterium]|nr:tryptophan-rich sensory protein [Patescibacteria group bacterium]MBU4078081.1 tryptophan-rich sensory protein [Patescibacteria group bacterium]
MFKPNYIIIPLITLVIAVFGNLITSQGMDWYNLLKLPSFTPAGAIIGIVWTIIFILTAISVLIFYNRAFHNSRFVIVITLFLINGVLNLLWSYLFFNKHLVGAAILEMLFLEATIIALIILIRFSSKIASILLYPYAIWVIFATYLAYQVLLLNT